jgi:hypothetical protein
MSMSIATQRLWIRRSRRLMLVITKVLTFIMYLLPPVWVFWFYRAWFRTFANKSSDGFWGGTILQVIVFFFGSIFMWNWHLTRDATPEEIRAARLADSCFDNTIVRRAAQWQRPITVGDIKQTQSDCADMWEKIERQKIQERALKQQLDK